eukprot:TRINITY_DN49719_c0_g1_i1.p1 TRINITY_DN49719_c0_g1~~TRINITY_DN49719_c0_g1_i1.p1  ORF type:complete len:762 (+),score=86.87 TRINITY_DN49719_c0_g1_i1:206-2287(+)
MLHGPTSCVDFTTCFNKTNAYVGVIPGNKRLGIPPLNMNDGPQGFRDLHIPGSSTAYPSVLTMAASWDRQLVRDWGAALGREFYDKGANVLLGPGVEVIRVPQNGRNFEYLSGEDPVLGDGLVEYAIRGIQSQKVMACAKHWFLNHQETNRGHTAYFYNGTDTKGESSETDERTLFELYLPPFQSAIRAGVASIMCSYNRVGGAWSCDNKDTLMGLLKTRLGFPGFVVSDWGATHATSIMRGLDMEMPGAFWMNSAKIKKGLESGSIATTAVDDSVYRILRSMFDAGVMDEPRSAWNARKVSRNVSSARAMELARQFSAGSTVLLKNSIGLLPLPSTNVSVALIGFADVNAVLAASGSGSVVPSSIVSPLEGVRTSLGEGTRVNFVNGTNIDAAQALAHQSDIALVFVGTISSEGRDRSSLSLDVGCELAQGVDTGSAVGPSKQCLGNAHHQNELVRRVAEANPKTVVVASVPGAVVMPWVAEVSAILTNFMPGQAAGNAIADVLFGRVNPSGKLPITFPNKDNETQLTPEQFPGVAGRTRYTEKLDIGYRYYDRHDITFTTGFPFGHGLSYTTFAYENLIIDGMRVSFTVTNSGSVAGAEVAQLYLGFPPSAGEPPSVLKAFEKTRILAAGEAFVITFHLAPKDLSLWDVQRHDWAGVSGRFEVMVGSSSRDIRLRGELINHLSLRGEILTS